MQPNVESSSSDKTTNIIQLPETSGQTPPEKRFSAPENFINRELSWLEFNRRVLEEAQDATQPLIERGKFLTIFSSNLDEFFEIRAGEKKKKPARKTGDVGPDGLTPTDTFNAIERTAH